MRRHGPVQLQLLWLRLHLLFVTVSLSLQYSPPLIPPRGEVNAADAFDIGSFDEEDTKGIKVTHHCLHVCWVCSARLGSVCVWYQVLDVGALTCRDVTWHVTRTQKRSRLVNAVSVLALNRTFPNGNPKRKQNRYIAADTREHQSGSVWAFVSLNYLVGLVPDEESYLKLSVCFCCVSGNISSLLH